MKEKVTDKKRRNFLKILALGGGGLVLAKLFGGSVVKLLDNNDGSGTPITKNFSQFNVMENDQGLVVSNKAGEELFVVDNGK